MTGVRNIQFVSLALVADIHAALVADRAFPLLVPEICFRPAAQRSELAFQPTAFQSTAGKFLRDSPEHGAGIVLHHVADQDAKSGKSAGQRRDNHSRDTERFRQFAGMQAAGAAKGHQRELSRIVAALDGDHAYGLLHGGVDHTDDSGGELFRAKFRPVALQPLADQAARALEIQSEISAQKALRLQSAEKQIGVRHRGWCRDRSR